MKTQRTIRRIVVLSLAFAAALLVGATSRALGDCGPFTDITFFCSPILELYYLGISAGTSPITYAPSQTTTRGEIAALVARSFNQTVKRTSRRGALGQWWTSRNEQVLGSTSMGDAPTHCASDGADVWVAIDDGTLSRVRAGDGKLLETWTGATASAGGGTVLVAMGRVFLVESTGTEPGTLYMIDPSQPAGTVTTVASNLGMLANGIAFDGSRIWTANFGGSVSIVTPGATLPWSVTTVTTGFTKPLHALYDGTNVWVTDFGSGTLLRLDSGGAILQTVDVGIGPENPVFDGTNIWVPSVARSAVTVVRASTGSVLTTLTGNGLLASLTAAFDGERVLVTNQSSSSVSLWRAADLAPLGFFSTGATSIPGGACSDGLNFWITARQPSQLLRF